MIHYRICILLGVSLSLGIAASQAESQTPSLSDLLAQDKVACGAFEAAYDTASATGKLAKFDGRLQMRAYLILQSCSSKKVSDQVTTRPDPKSIPTL